jgi:hypothetical protein
LHYLQQKSAIKSALPRFISAQPRVTAHVTSLLTVKAFTKPEKKERIEIEKKL